MSVILATVNELHSLISFSITSKHFAVFLQFLSSNKSLFPPPLKLWAVHSTQSLRL
uniref:Uncharacterized protein n=1 Tax=Anguilla anguilla TaxID=7936 RepID=A0A0E9QNP3_ANGAN